MHLFDGRTLPAPANILLPDGNTYGECSGLRLDGTVVSGHANGNPYGYNTNNYCPITVSAPGAEPVYVRIWQVR